MYDSAQYQYRRRSRGDDPSSFEMRRLLCEIQVVVGTRCGGGTHKVDVVAKKPGHQILVSVKWQQTGGTAEQKVPFEVMCRADAVRFGKATGAYLVLGGDGWTLRDYFTSGALAEHLIHVEHVRILTLEAFIRQANNGRL
jgi:hypothetical protein